jgi:hypothetical protein
VDDQPSRVRPQVVMLIIFLVIFLGVMAALSGDMAGLRWLKFTGVFIAIGGIFSMAAASIIMSMPKAGRQKPKKTQQPLTVERADTTNKLLPVGENDFVPSVVENTTELLQTVKPQLRK